MSQPTLKTTLSALESQLGLLSLALKDGAVDDMALQAQQFQSLVVEANALLAPWKPLGAHMQEVDAARLRALGAGLARVREHMLRRQALVEQALHMVVPALHTPVYAAAAGPYGRGTQSSGRFQAFSA
ncbi:hypothetical protein [Rhodoferax sp. TS-BS-61-7]|jgi:hypothetical protein|uniref:hypothetical protein n=1 Tax=Rhodoferax sp. TS-BS-61-7 TaxID=2094194 RepID=UPI000CF6B86A|nr:hypothetical protein [Rhodoferax sp. TS-BS-61-7]PQA77767.1 hypothetical protein C5F53_11215 [Rhodoferax sp. TS-BS-61-7]